MAINPDCKAAWFNRGVSLANLGRYEEAIASFERAVAIKPDYHEAWSNRGASRHNLGRYDEAIAFFDTALTIKRDEWQVWINRGIAAGNSIHPLNPLQNLLSATSALALENPALNQRGYEGQLTSYQEGLKYCRRDTHPEGWGRLHWAIGDAKYYRGRRDARRGAFWREARTSYHTALETLTETAFPEAHLDVVQRLFRVLVGLGETDAADEWRLHGLSVLQKLLNQPISSFAKQQLTEKFWFLRQLGVDVLVQKGLVVEALETAERDKNLYLTWILDAYRETTLSPTWREMREFLPAGTAVIYWHLSDVALTTFILKSGELAPLVLRHGSDSLPLTASEENPSFPHDTFLPARRLEDWLTDWQKHYQDYRATAKTKATRNSHPWFAQIPEKLRELGEILDIRGILSHLQGMERLILIPHRDLHSVSLEALFPDSFTLTRLPSLQIGRHLAANSAPARASRVLSVEHPKNDLLRLAFAPFESAAISRMFDNPSRYKDATATLAVVTSALQNTNTVFHFTGHASHEPANSRQSALYLAGTDTLTLEEIRRLTLENYHLVTLSACETALAKDLIKIDCIGLASAFLQQRVSHVVSTLWTVPDEGSSLLMIQYYRLRRQLDEPAALAEAKQWLRQLTWGDIRQFYEEWLRDFQTPPAETKELCRAVEDAIKRVSEEDASQPPYQHPYYWAAFTISGLAI